MLAEFIASLSDDFPEARLELARPARDAEEAAQRAEAVCEQYVEVVGCEPDLRRQAAYEDYIMSFASVMGVEPSKVRTVVELGLAGAAVTAASAAAIYLTEGSAHAADVVAHSHGAVDLVGALHDGGAAAGDVAATVAEGAGHAFDVVDAVGTLGLSILLSLGIGKWFKSQNDEKRTRLAWLTERVTLRGRLAKALMTPSQTNTVRTTLVRLR